MTELTILVLYVVEFLPSFLELVVLPGTGPSRHSRTYDIERLLSRLRDQSDTDGLLTTPNGLGADSRQGAHCEVHFMSRIWCVSPRLSHLHSSQ